MTKEVAINWLNLISINKEMMINHINRIYDEFESRSCNTCTHCDKSTLTQLKQAYCNKLQTSIKDYDKFYCAYWKE